MKANFTLILLLLCSFFSVAQIRPTPILERRISINAAGEKLPAVLTRIAQQAGFSFSYNATVINQDQIVTLRAENKTVREVLNMIFDGGLTYKEKSNHLILTRTPASPKKTASVLSISGYVEDEATGQKIPDASVYDKTTLSSAITDEYGYYRIKIDAPKEQGPVTLLVRKIHYADTSVIVTAAENQYINIVIKPVALPALPVVASPADTTKKKAEELDMPFDDEANVQNIHDTLYRDVQISVLPFLGSNGRLSGNIINDYSINIFGGYSLGTRRIELGFFLNADRGSVSYLQIAGIGNFVGKNIYGVQGAGFFNVNGGDAFAFQFAGLSNVNLGDTKGVQITGGANINLNEAKGVQFAGLTNINRKSADGVLIAGLGNFANGNSEGFQGAGLANIQVKDYKGSQVAGIANIATGKIHGSQISSLFNYARSVHGSQIGLVNISDSLSGMPIGLLSFVNHGYHKLEFSADEVFYTNIAFRTGVRKFYNIINVGLKPENTVGSPSTVWTFGYGIGTAPRINRWLSLNFDLTSNQVNKGGFTKSLSLLNKLYVGLDARLARKFSITFGGTLNGYLSDPSASDNPILFTNYLPRIAYHNDYNSHVNLKMWVGAKVGIRFL